jgi:hypothetical protein
MVGDCGCSGAMTAEANGSCATLYTAGGGKWALVLSQTSASRKPATEPRNGGRCWPAMAAGCAGLVGTTCERQVIAGADLAGEQIVKFHLTLPFHMNSGAALKHVVVGQNLHSCLGHLNTAGAAQ